MATNICALLGLLRNVCFQLVLGSAFYLLGKLAEARLPNLEVGLGESMFFWGVLEVKVEF